jgi:hypothetical protein
VSPASANHTPADPLVALVYELLDAHRDTIELADPRPELVWRAHLDYLRALQRAGRAMLAQVVAGPTATATPSDQGQRVVSHDRPHHVVSHDRPEPR